MSYSVAAFDLEERVNCLENHNPICVDWVEITYKNLGIKMKFCSSDELGTVNMDGENELTFEFFSNRRIQHSGFSFFLQCTTASVVQNVSGGGLSEAQDFETCTQPGQRPILGFVSYIILYNNYRSSL